MWRRKILRLYACVSKFPCASNRPAFHQPEGVPYFVAKVTTLFAEFFVEKEVITGGGTEEHTGTNAIGPKLFDQVERVG